MAPDADSSEERLQTGRLAWCLKGAKRWSYLLAFICVVFAALGLALIPLNLSMIAAGLWGPVGWGTHLYFPAAGSVGALAFALIGYAAGKLRGDASAF